MPHHHIDRDTEIKNLIKAAQKAAQRMNGTFIVDTHKVQAFSESKRPDQAQPQKKRTA